MPVGARPVSGCQVNKRTDLPAITFLGRAIGHLRRIARAIPGGMVPYLDRYSLRKQGKSGTNEWRAYLHHFRAPDADGHHNHPFAWSLSIVLRGSYTEEVLHRPLASCPNMPATLESRRVRWFNFIRADKYHRITELHPGRGAAPDAGCWTLFLAGPLRRRDNGDPTGWGFWVPGRGHVDWDILERERVAAAAVAKRAHDTAAPDAGRAGTWARLASFRQN